MINEALLNPGSIVVVGASNDVEKPGGKILKNILDGAFKGDLSAVNHKELTVQGLSCHASVDELGETDLAILCVPARFCPELVHTLAHEKETRAFIILSAGFAEYGDEGRGWEAQIVETVNSVNACLIGPNCIGVLNANYNGVFTTPIPKLDPGGCDLISSSGSTAVFIMEAGIPLGLRFANVYSVGNAAQTGVEEVLEYLDLNHDPKKHSSIKLLYMESISDPRKLLKHASSLVRKGVRIAAIKAGTTEAGSRAAASHTGALSSSDSAVRALFRKAGIVYCSSREELVSVASVFNYRELKGKNIAVITHAGGPAVMLTDALSSGGVSIPAIEGPDADSLLSVLHPGSSVGNPIDFLATGTAEQLGTIIDYCEHRFEHIDAMVVVFGSPGLFGVSNVYDVLSEKLEICSKPIYPVLPSLVNAHEEIREFIRKGHINFPDEVVLGRALVAIQSTPAPRVCDTPEPAVDADRIREIMDSASDGFLSPGEVTALLDAAGIRRVTEHIISRQSEIVRLAESLEFPVVMKVVGPVHKTDVGGVILDIQSIHEMKEAFGTLMQIDGAVATLVQPMLTGTELFIGVKRESNFGHLVFCGLGGIFIEVLNDFSYCLAPVGETESADMIRRLKAYPVLRGARGREGVDEAMFGEVIQRISTLVAAAPEITEIDINPLMGSAQTVTALDTRIRIEK